MNERRTLAPGGSHARCTSEIATRLEIPTELEKAWLESMTLIIDASQLHFPETIFWDFDFLGAALLAEYPDANELRFRAEQIVGFHKVYGQNSIIRFRYVHDFTYGFDWAKWVGRAPELRADFGPFSPEFLDHVQNRGQELLQLIEEDDETYPKLPDGNPRNPFVFSREPSEETQLFETLAERNLLPVKAWETDSEARWQEPFAKLREEVAAELGITK